MTTKRVPQEVQKLVSLPTVGLRESFKGFETVKDFLVRFGYLGVDVQRTGLLDETTSIALVKYQALHSLPISGVFDAATREMMSRARCGVPDLNPATGIAFATVCAWQWLGQNQAAIAP